MSRNIVSDVIISRGSAVLSDKDGNIFIVPHSGYLKKHKNLTFLGLINEQIRTQILTYGYFDRFK